MSPKSTSSFNLHPGRIIAGNNEVLGLLGGGWEGEVYKIREINTDIECAAKLFYPARNPRDRAAVAFAKKLHALRECPILIRYHTQEKITFNREPVTVLISEFVEGELLSEHLSRLPGKRMQPFQAMHLLHALTTGIESIHHSGEYHGDLHSDNVIVRRYGLSYELKLLDLFHWGRVRRSYMQEDICNLVALFHECLGGGRHYARQPPQVKAVCCGLKRTLILKKYRTAADLRLHLETQSWS